jgi:hypothetical protein
MRLGWLARAAFFWFAFPAFPVALDFRILFSYTEMVRGAGESEPKFFSFGLSFP